MAATMPRVFISYTSNDAPFAEWLAATLESSNTEVWIDKWKIGVGDSIVSRVNEGIAAADNIIVMLSPASVASRWVQQEIGAAFTLMLTERGVKLLPALIENCEIPPLLAQYRYADFRVDKSRGLRELIAAILPSAGLREDLLVLFSRLNELLQDADTFFVQQAARATPRVERSELPLQAEWVQKGWRALHSLDGMFDRLVEKRYALEVGGHPAQPSGDSFDFYAKFNFLVSIGLPIRSEAWADTRDFRNRHTHSSSGVTRSLWAAESLKRQRERLAELDRVGRVLAFVNGR